MEVTRHFEYDINNSIKRIKDILDADYSNFTTRVHIPHRSELTFRNGFYVDVTSLFIDIVGSSNLTDVHRRPVLAKIYDCFISESIAVMTEPDICKEISINGDCVWGVFDTTSKEDLDTVFKVALQLNTTINTLNDQLGKKYSQIEVGIGIDYGRALMVKSGYSGSGLNDVIWMGDVVNTACHLANKAGRQGKAPILVSQGFHSKLNTNSLHSEWFDIEVGNYYEYW